jgi:hypothetical protein
MSEIVEVQVREIYGRVFLYEMNWNGSLSVVRTVI